MVPVGMNVNFGNMYKLDRWVVQKWTFSRDAYSTFNFAW